MKPRVFYFLEEDEDEIALEIRIFFADHYVCIHGDYGKGFSVESYGKSGYKETLRNHLDPDMSWTELDLESCSLPDLT